jgi:hypothetical protein
MQFTIELERMENGYWLAEVKGLCHRMGAVGQDRLEAFRLAQAQALRFLAEQLEREGTYSPAAPTMSLAFDIV